MTRRTDLHPVLDRPDVGAPFFSTWQVGTPERQRLTVQAVADTWQSRPWPTDGLLGYFVYTADDGSGLLHYSQWADEQAYEAFVRTRRQERNDAIDTAVPGIERVGLGRYRRYRSLTGDGDRADRVPGCVVIVDVEFEGPDPARQRAWVDAVEEALAAEPHPHPGGISAHFHLATDGTRVLNYAEWESARHHVDALASPGDGVGSPSALWQRVQTWPGLRSSTVRRYEYALGLVAD
ncbi:MULTISPECIES: antibiotic biosynthesis monooxygenase [Streptomyces]|uniref:Quinol monooxygenase YgiN n=1 Tax=Streptomyces stelliscabiei TaxID=146820 RepID=A0A8I0TSE7_9ACTN|nr:MULTISPECIES: antibiotic biosynthesis monooxygenase [Streptomyces]KND44818.1 antibiotic biosynthesis monooxygenase [Streptomyces stelliscabiei]MBE1596183.1 quinol monooxygenase YgiN [Streptomyces stelliscabiei]MDX2519677.1 antibiotic biosynthesis monooxygenase [Streptomyces stelliscabiei]SOD78677.1 Antibiotic biosynthesis monooxygenase [Streptomyces sp. 1222.2]